MDEHLYKDKTADISNKLQCKNCSAPVSFVPGTNGTSCSYCGTYNEVMFSAEAQFAAAQELSYSNYQNIDDSEKLSVQVLKCNGCGASASYSNTTSATNCAFCASALVINNGTTASIIKPKAMIPFVVTQQTALEQFRKYAKGQFFAPNDFRNMTKKTENLFGMYIPYWTYDILVSTQYNGERGIDYQATETYTATENGRNVMRTRTVTKTNWTDVRGIVSNNFDDVTVIASKSLPSKQANSLNPWNYKALVPYNDAYIAGFSAEMYNINLDQGLKDAFELMRPEIEQTIRYNIGGDRQRVGTYNSNYQKVTFKHILLPIWINTYKYKDKTYHFLINGQTGEVQGDQPISVLKVLGVVLGILLIAVLFFIMFGGKH